jgi:hydrogenase nickel incorporation protein HypA/HybF
VHERKLMDDLMQKIDSEAAAAGAQRVTKVRVRLGALSHFTEAHFREHFVDASRGTVAEGAEVTAELRTDATEPEAQGVVLESIEVEVAADARVSARADGESPGDVDAQGGARAAPSEAADGSGAA